MIGTGHGFVHELYNTCFVINDKFLIDTGGSADIVKNLKLSGTDLSNIHDIYQMILMMKVMIKMLFYILQ